MKDVYQYILEKLDLYDVMDCCEVCEDPEQKILKEYERIKNNPEEMKKMMDYLNLE
mgnify:FL=1|jgi:hypothetical protein